MLSRDKPHRFKKECFFDGLETEVERKVCGLDYNPDGPPFHLRSLWRKNTFGNHKSVAPGRFFQFLSQIDNFIFRQPNHNFLFQIMEKFFMPDHSDLLNSFLIFLTPEEAVKINKTMDYFLQVNLSKFLNKLNIFYQKQPAQVRFCVKLLQMFKFITDTELFLETICNFRGIVLIICICFRFPSDP